MTETTTEPTRSHERGVQAWPAGASWILAAGIALLGLGVATHVAFKAYERLESREENAQAGMKAQAARDYERSQLVAKLGANATPEALAAIDEKLSLSERPVVPGRYQVVHATVEGTLFVTANSDRAKLLPEPKPERTAFLVDTSTGDVWQLSPRYMDLDSRESHPAFFTQIENASIRPRQAAYMDSMRSSRKSK